MRRRSTSARVRARASACRRPFFPSGRSLSSPCQRPRLPASAWRMMTSTAICGTGSLVEPGQEREGAIALVAEQPEGFLDGEPAQLVNLRVGQEAATDRLHDPVEDDLVAPLAVPVSGAGERPEEAAAESGLLLDLAQTCLLQRLALVQLSLGEGPVVVPGTVYQCDLDQPPRTGPADQSARSLDHRHPIELADAVLGTGPAHAGFSQVRSFARLSRFQAAGHRLLERAARSTSWAWSSP